jgi:ammonium transporter, Amt family
LGFFSASVMRAVGPASYALLALVSFAAHAQNTQPSPTQAELAMTLDSIRTLIALSFGCLAGLVGTAMFFSSLVRVKNTLATIGQVFIALSCAVLGWIGLRALVHDSGALVSTTTVVPGTMLGLLIATSGLILGSAVERLRSIAVAILGLGWAALIFTPISFAIWDPLPGLSATLFRDWAGASVQLAVGAFALGISLAVGNRHGYGRIPMPPYHMGLALFGGTLIFIGLSGFNELGAGERAATAVSGAINSGIAACMGLLVWSICEQFVRGVSSTLGMISGALCGVVTVSAVAGWVPLVYAIGLGGIGSLAGFFGAVVVRRWHNVDDTFDIFAIHSVPAAVGLLALPFVVADASDRIYAQITGVLAIALYAFAIGSALAFLLKKLGVLRVAFDEEDAGLDLTRYGETVHPPQTTL